MSSWLMKSNISVSFYSVRVNIIIIIYGGLLKFSLRMVFLVVCFCCFFWHSSKIQCINTFYEIVLIPFIKLKTSNKLHIKLIKFFKQNFIFIPLCFKDVMLKWSFVGIRYEKQHKKSVRLWNITHRRMLSSGLFFFIFKWIHFNQSIFVIPQIYSKIWCILIIWDDYSLKTNNII